MNAANVIGAMLCAAMLGAVQAQSAAPPGPAAPPLPAASAASQATTSPTVRAAEGARTPGELRPEQPVVPQIAVPLRRDAKADDAGAVAGAVDDRAARCRALETKAQRQACERQAVSGPRTPARAPEGKRP